MEWDAPHILGLCLLAAVLVGLALAYARESTLARATILRWAADQGLGDVQLHGTSLRPHPQVGKAHTGDVTYRLTAIGTDGQPVMGFVKCNTFRRRRAVPPTVEGQLTPSPVRGFPVRPLRSDGASSELGVVHHAGPPFAAW